MLKTLPYLLLLFLLATACNSADDKGADPAPLTTSIALQAPVLLNDSTAQLSWSALNNPNFQEYRLKRWEVLNDPTAATFTVRPNSLSSPTVAYPDATLPYADDVQYQVVGVLTSGQTIESNTVTLHRPGVHIARAPIYDVLFDEPSRTLYFVGNTGTISQYSLAFQQITKTIQVGQNINYGSLATFRGRRELYLPTQNGRVLIYDAATLTPLDELRVEPVPAPHGLTSVLASHDRLYISTGPYNGPTLRVYDRATKAPLPYQNNLDWYSQRLYPVPGTSDTELVGMAQYVFPMFHTYYSFSAGGAFLGTQQNVSQRNHQTDGRIFAFFPDGQRYISGAYGDVYSKTTAYLSGLPRLPTTFTCYGPDAATQTLYAGTTDRRIYAFGLQAPHPLLHTRKTRFYPFKILKDPAGGFITLSIDTPIEAFFLNTTFYDAKVLVEHLD
ncbi:YncE family protein [Hymenobacter chitinivorans]|uniref:Fibronectin type-III domain-containing protein n=1 Tax=Hymenobacter chitinivorans DSM 11115 TaxID=1121954 RepID=A0A2M9BSX5_9BACT|nr:hypothetical protein [Hymenobacter chitinivorans]PJJ61031.1 hypothetical protein CLV45_2468 [Hymenobacter chitinivorans DSM 11115]